MIHQLRKNVTDLHFKRGVPAWKRRLYIPTYRVGDAARYAGVTTQTILNWQSATPFEKQAISTRSKGDSLNYLQLVELAFVAALRKTGVKLSEIKEARAYIAVQLGSEYPFSDHRFKTDGKDILMELSQFEQSESKDKLVKTNKGGQLAWAEIIDTKFTEFEYQDDLAVKWHAGGKESPVLIDPRVSFGAPMVKGVATWAIRGRFEAGEPREDIAEDFSLKAEDVDYALKFEGILLGKFNAGHY